MEYKLNCAQLRQMAPRLHAGDRVLLSGRVYTSRDAAHKRIVAAMDAGEPLPYDLQDAVIYYAGPTPAPEGLAVGACGPTTSSRMDPYAPRLLDAGVVAMEARASVTPPCVMPLYATRLCICVPSAAPVRWLPSALRPAK